MSQLARVVRFISNAYKYLILNLQGCKVKNHTISIKSQKIIELDIKYKKN
jgi:hypothetical protein